MCSEVLNFDIKPLQREHYQLIAEWEHGAQPHADWPKYIEEMSAPHWVRLGLYLDSMVAGAVSFEKITPEVARVHVVTRRHAFHPNYLAFVLREIAKVILEDVKVIEAVVSDDKRAVSRLAVRVGMRREDIFPWQKRFVLTRADVIDEQS